MGNSKSERIRISDFGIKNSNFKNYGKRVN
jgi:hypothetical protein